MAVGECIRVARVFNGTYTIRNRNTGVYRTFRIKTQPHEADFAPDKRIVGLLTGPDNTHSYTNFAFIDNDGVYIWRKRSSQSRQWNWFGEMLWYIVTGTHHPRFDINRYEVMHEGRCLICNRKLTTPDSITRGIGPICEQNIGFFAEKVRKE